MLPNKVKNFAALFYHSYQANFLPIFGINVSERLQKTLFIFSHLILNTHISLELIVSHHQTIHSIFYGPTKEMIQGHRNPTLPYTPFQLKWQKVRQHPVVEVVIVVSNIARTAASNVKGYYRWEALIKVPWWQIAVLSHISFFYQPR